VPQNRKQAHDEENLYQKIQWILETFYNEGLLKFYESCMLESIKNAVKKFTTMGILSIEKKQIKRNAFKTYIHVTKSFQDEAKIEEVFYSISFYIPYCPNADISFF
jgi:CRISPR/Cas system-associated endonuclease Cas3-HD